MKWHRDNRSEDGVMRIPVNSPVWRNMEEKYDKLKDARSVMLQICTDRIKLAGLNSVSDSVWPITFTLLNLNLQLAMHKGHVLLFTIVPSIFHTPYTTYTCCRYTHYVFYLLLNFEFKRPNTVGVAQ